MLLNTTAADYFNVRLADEIVDNIFEKTQEHNFFFIFVGISNELATITWMFLLILLD